MYLVQHIIINAPLDAVFQPRDPPPPHLGLADGRVAQSLAQLAIVEKQCIHVWVNVQCYKVFLGSQ